MCIKEPVLNKKLDIVTSDYRVGDCFLAAVYLYISYIYGNADDLLQFAWYFSCDNKQQDKLMIRLIHYDEIKEYVLKKYGISFVFLSSINTMNLSKVVVNEIEQGRPVGLTVDYTKCPWTRGSYEKEYVYHFILIIGYFNDFYWCIDNEADTAQLFQRDEVEKMVKEILLFDDSKKILRIQSGNESFGNTGYWAHREKMLYDIDTICSFVLQKNKPYYMASKLKLISQNYENFGYYLETNIRNLKALTCINNLQSRFAMLSLLTIKYCATSNDNTQKLIENNFEEIRQNEKMLRKVLKGDR